MSITSALMISAAPALVLLGVAGAAIAETSRPEASDRARLNLLRVLLWCYGIAVAGHGVAQAVLLTRSNFEGFTAAAWSPLVIFSAGAAATAWHIRRLRRQVVVRN